MAPDGPDVAPFSRFGEILGRAFNSYFTQWSAWPVPLLVCGLITIASYVACFFPLLLAQGPLVCGLYWCALLNLRGWPVETGSLGRGWQLFWPAMSSNIALLLVEAIPGILIGIVAVAVLAFSGLLQVKPGAPPDPADVFGLMFSLMFVWMPLAFVGMLWQFWFRTRTMFVMPLIADRGYDFSTAFRASWEATRRRFWERLLLLVLAQIIATLGVYLCYVGLLFTLPLQFMIIAAAYEDEFGIAEVPARAALPGDPTGSPFQAAGGETASKLADGGNAAFLS